MKYEWRKYIDEMRLHGYAVCVITPEALNGADRDWVEDCMQEEADNCVEAWENDNDESSN